MKKDVIKELIIWVLIFFLAIAAADIITKHVIIKAAVPSESMENTIQVGDNIIGLRLAYLFDDPERGDIILFPCPDNPELVYVKRIIGLPSETVEIKNGYVYINETLLEESYLKEDMVGEYGPFKVPENGYFMMGDNRNNSNDSRFWQNKYVDKDDIIAKVMFLK